MKFVLSLFTTAVLCFSSSAFAGLLLEVDGPDDASTLTIEADQAALISFELTADFTNTSLDAPAFCFAPCVGSMWLIQDAGFGPSLGNIIWNTTFDGVDEFTTPFFSNLDLDSGLYYFVLGMMEGTGFWYRTATPTMLETADAFYGYGYGDAFADAAVPLPYQSDFNLILGGETLVFSLTGDPVGSNDNGGEGPGTPPTTTIDEPTTLLLALAGLIGLIARRRT